MNKNLILKINESKKTYHSIKIGDKQVLFDFDKMLIIRGNEILNLILQQESVNVKFIEELEKNFGTDAVSTTLLQVEKMIDSTIIFKKDYTLELQHKPTEFVHAELSFPP